MVVCSFFYCFIVCQVFCDYNGVYCCDVGIYVCSEVCFVSSVVELFLFLESGSEFVFVSLCSGCNGCCMICDEGVIDQHCIIKK